MQISVGIDIAKEIHWVTAIDAAAVVLIDRRLENTPTAIAELIDELAVFGGRVRIGFDVVGGIAGLAEAMLAEAGFALVHVPGLAVNRARQGSVGGENKSDPRDARIIADQVRIRSDLRPIAPAQELDLEIRLLVGRRSDLATSQTQRLGRMHDLLVGIFPGLERRLDLTSKGALVLLGRFVTPAELRGAGKARLVRHLKAAGGLPHVEALAERALEVAAEQRDGGPLQIGVDVQIELRRALLHPRQSTRCKCRTKNPQKCRGKIPHFRGLRSVGIRHSRLRFLAAGRVVLAAAAG